jgi:hypothetical protein
MITWVDSEDEADAVLDMELDDESQSHKEGEKGNDEVKRILELQFRVRQMEPELKEKDAKPRLVAAIQQEIT